MDLILALIVPVLLFVLRDNLVAREKDHVLFSLGSSARNIEHVLRRNGFKMSSEEYTRLRNLLSITYGLIEEAGGMMADREIRGRELITYADRIHRIAFSIERIGPRRAFRKHRRDFDLAEQE